jgi:hypothetical protein
MDKLIIPGFDNSKNLKQNFADELAKASEEEFLDITEKFIWLSAYANNNPRSDYHWKADACYDEANRRGKPEIYQRAWKIVAGE